MTDPVIRALTASDVHLFDTLPDPLRAAEAFGKAVYRPEWKRVALREGRVVARAAWWGGPEDTEPLTVEWFDFADGEEEAATELLRTAPWQVGLELVLPGGWREDPVMRAAAEARTAAARAAGHTPLVERFVYRWTPECGLPERPGRLEFGPEPDDAVFFDALRRIHSDTLDAHARKAIAEGGLDRAAQEELDFFRWCPSPREWWQVARRTAPWPASTSRPTTPPAPASASSASCRSTGGTDTRTTCSPSARTTSSSTAPSSSPAPPTRATSRWRHTSRRPAIRSSGNG